MRCPGHASHSTTSHYLNAAATEERHFPEWLFEGACRRLAMGGRGAAVRAAVAGRVAGDVVAAADTAVVHTYRIATLPGSLLGDGTTEASLGLGVF